MLDTYKDMVSKLKNELDTFVSLAEGGAEGHGSKTKALEARKLSNQIAKDLKEFRQLSLENDKSK